MTEPSTGFWSQRRTLTAIALSMLALVEIVDLTIVSIVMPQIMGGLGVNINTVAMVTTSYVVAAAIFIPLSGLVIQRYGMKQVVLTSTITFGVFSMLCGMASTFTQMIIFRFMQGVGGAFLPAVAQSYIASRFKGKENARMMGLFSMVVVMGPIIGPVAGGFIAENLSWRWIFYVNLPLCIIAYVAIMWLMEPTKGERIKIDYISFIFMAIGIGCLEYFVDEGNRNNWFQSFEIIIIFAISMVFIGFFIWRGMTTSSVINFRLFKNLNFVISCALMFCAMVFITGTMAFFPTMLQRIYAFPVDLAGYITAPRGLAALIAAPLITKLMQVIYPRNILLSGLMIFASSCFLLAKFSIHFNFILIIVLMIIQGIGMMAIILPLMQFVFIGIADSENSDASGIFNFFRNFGVSVGTSLASTVIAHMQQIHYHDLTRHITPYSDGLRLWQEALHNVPMKQQMAIINSEIMEQSGLLSFLNAYYLFGVGLIVLLIMPFLLNKLRPGEIDA